MNGVPSLKSICASTIPHLYKSDELSQDWKTKPAIELACLPLFKDASDDYIKLVFNALEEVLHHGTVNEQEKACMALLRTCQQSTLPESIIYPSKLFLLKYLEKSGCAAQKNVPCFAKISDPDQMIIHGLKEFLLRKIHNAHGEVSVKKSAENSESATQWTMQDEKNLEAELEEISQVYRYIQGVDEQIDHLLLDSAVEFLMNGKREAADIICQTLIDLSKDNEHVKEAYSFKQILPPRNGSPNATPQLLTHLDFVVQCPNRPLAAYWLGVCCKDPQKEIHYLSQAALLGHSLAIARLNDKAKNAKEFECTALSYICRQVTKIDSQEWTKQVHALAKKLTAAIEFKKKALPIYSEQKKLGIDQSATFKERMLIGKSMLKLTGDDLLAGIEIIDALSKLNHPLAPAAKEILDTWLNEGTNRIWLIKQYVILCDKAPSLYKSKLSEQMKSFVQRLHSLKEKGDTIASEQLVYQLLDMTVELSFLKKDDTIKIVDIDGTGDMATYCSFIYQILLDSGAITNVNTIGELNIRKAIFDGKLRLSDASVETCFANAAKTPGRPAAAFEAGLILCSQIHSVSSNKNIQLALTYFENAAKEGYEPEQNVLDQIKPLAQGLFMLAEDCMAQASWLKSFNDKVLDIYRLAGYAGHREAHFKFLELSVKKKHDLQAHFELGERYLTGAHAPYPKQNVRMGQSLLETAAKKGHAPSAFLLAHYFSPKTSHQPKLTSTDFMYKTPETKMLDYLELGIQSSFDAGVGFKEVIDQLHPVVIEGVFAVSERYRQQHKNEEVANILLDLAVQKGNDAAKAKKFSILQQQSQAQEIKNKKDQPTEKKEERTLKFNSDAQRGAEEFLSEL